MNILFLTLNTFETLDSHTIYADLLNEFIRNGHKVYALSPVEKKYGVKTHITEEKNATIVRVQVYDMYNVNMIKKGISTVMIGSQYKRAINQFFGKVKFDLVLYSTPPITLLPAIEYIKKRDAAKSYLLLKDIFPQNAVDIGIISKTGLKGLLYKHFRRQEKKLYAISDRIGCMSQANVDYVIKHNPEIDPLIVEECPNCIEIIDKSVTPDARRAIREKYGIPLDKTVFAYGGNLGRPQGIGFMIRCLEEARSCPDAHFLVAGDGTDYPLLENYIKEKRPPHVTLFKRLPKDEYDTLIAACDVGLIFLDHRFTIPNFPSRMLGYMQARLPILACTDPNTDIGDIISRGGYGWKCESDDPKTFAGLVSDILSADRASMGEAGYEYLQKHYTTSIAYGIIMK